ncbi:hypothetical protein EYF80_044992 [Liparis tanakae]|uniref:Testis development-related protein n=1 Tax=Liparis tanakae TaxID=230148 RepID=A0A4Z2FU55_9TELE|nr:hypothetical protein EYF80_044992 [Liparis tanakae]
MKEDDVPPPLSAGTKAAVDSACSTRPAVPEREERRHDAPLNRSWAPGRAAENQRAWKQVEVGPTETSRGRERRVGGESDPQGHTEVFRGRGPRASSIFSCEDEPGVESLQEQSAEDPEPGLQVTEVENDVSPLQEDEGPNAVSQLAKKMQGAGTKSWNRLSSLFNKDDEHQLLEETESPPVADHPLAMKPETPPPRPTKRAAIWDSFAANWAAKKQAEAAAAATAAAAVANEAGAGQAEDGVAEAGGEESQGGYIPQGEESEEGGGGGGGGGGRSGNSFSKYVSLGGGSEDTSFKWNFVTSKLAELKTKSN